MNSGNPGSDFRLKQPFTFQKDVIDCFVLEVQAPGSTPSNPYIYNLCLEQNSGVLLFEETERVDFYLYVEGSSLDYLTTEDDNFYIYATES